MPRCHAVLALLVTVLATSLMAAPAQAASYTPGTYEYTVPAGITGLSIDAVGGAGGSGGWSPGFGGGSQAPGAPGGTVRAQVPVTPGEKLTIIVGSGGGTGTLFTPGTGGAAGDYTGGSGGVGLASNAGGGGGGATVVLRENGTVLLVAGGGGGGGADALNGPGFPEFMGGGGGAGGAQPQPGGGGTGNQRSGAGGGGGADTGYTHGGTGGLGAGSVGAGGGGGGGRWAGHGGDAGEVRVNLTALISTAGGGGGGGSNYVIGGSRGVTHGVDNQSAGAGGILRLDPATVTTTTIGVENDGEMGPNNRGIVFTAYVAGGGTGGTVAFTGRGLTINTGGTFQDMTFCDAAPVVNGVATCAPTLAAGGYLVKATFSGNFLASPSASGEIQKDIGRYTAVNFLGNPPTRAGTNEQITLTVQVQGASPTGSIRWEGTGPTTNCTGRLSYGSSGYTTSCTFRTVTSTFNMNVVARYAGTASANLLDRTAASVASQPIQVVSTPIAMFHNYVTGGPVIQAGGVVQLSACVAWAGVHCPARAYGHTVQWSMPGVPCEEFFDGNLDKWVYTCRPTVPGRYTFHSEFHPSGFPKGFCDQQPSSSATCATGFYFPEANTSITVRGPLHHLGVTSGNGQPTVDEPFQLAATPRDVAENLLPTALTTTAVEFVDGNGDPDPGLGRCYLDGRCIAYETGFQRVRVQANGVSGVVEVGVQASSTRRRVEVLDSLVAAQGMSQNGNPEIRVQVEAPFDNDVVDFYVDGYAFGQLCARDYTRTYSQAPAGSFRAACRFRPEALPTRGEHELIVVYREWDGQPTTIRTSFWVSGPRSIVDVFPATSDDPVAGEPYALEVRDSDEDHFDLGATADIASITMDGGTCNTAQRTCTPTESGEHTITVKVNGLPDATLGVEVQPAALETITGAVSATTRAGELVDLGIVGRDRFGNVVALAPGDLAWEMNGSDCPDEGCRPTRAGAYTTIRVQPSYVGGWAHEIRAVVTVVPNAPVALGITGTQTEFVVDEASTFTLSGVDAWNNPVTDILAHTSVTIPGGTCTGGAGAITTCSTTRAGALDITATSTTGATASLRVDVRAGNGVANRLRTTSPAPVVVGGTVDFELFWADRYGNFLQDQTYLLGDWIHLTSSDPSASCSARSCTVPSTGSIRFDANAYIAPEYSASTTVDVVAGPWASVDLSTTETSIVAGTTFHYTATGRDIGLNEALITPGQFAAGLQGGETCTITQLTPSTLDVACVAHGAGDRILYLLAGDDAINTQNLHVTAGAAARLEIAGPATLVSGAPSDPYDVTAFDAWNNPTTLPVDVAVTVDGVPCPDRRCTGGIAGVATVQAASSSTTPASQGVVVEPGEATELTILGPSSVVSGEHNWWSVSAVDAAGNDLGDVSAGALLTSDGASCTANECTFGVAGTRTLFVQYQSGLASYPVEVVPGPAQTFTASAIVASVEAGTVVPVEIVMRDAARNETGDPGGALSLTSTSGDCSGATSCAPTTAGPNVITLWRDGVEVAQFGMDVTPSTPVRLEVAASHAVQAGNTTVAIPATAVDAYENEVATGTGFATYTFVHGEGTCAGAICSADEVGTYEIDVAAYGLHAQTTLIVTPGPAVGIEMTPLVSTVVAGELETYSVTGVDAHGNEIDDLTADTDFTIDGERSRCEDNACTAELVGSYTVTASSGGNEAEAHLTVTAAPIDALRVTTDASVVAGTYATIEAMGVDEFGNETGSETLSATYTIADGTCVENDNRCTATSTGTHLVTAQLGANVSGTVELEITPAETSGFEIAAATPTIVSGASTAVTATAVDEYGNDVRDVTTSTAFTIDGDRACPNASCTGRTAGTRTITGRWEAYPAATTTVEVEVGALDHITLRPAAGTHVAGTSQTYVADGFDFWGNDLGDVTDGTDFTIDDPDGSCTGTSCVAVRAGANTVTGTRGGLTATALHVVEPAPLAALDVTPASATIVARGAATFAASGLDEFGNPRTDDLGAVTYSIDAGSCEGAVCTSATAGDRTVTARTAAGIEGTATLHVDAGALDHFTLAADPDEIVAGRSTTISADGFDADDNPLGDVTSSLGFTVDEGGECDGASCELTKAGTRTITGTVGTITGTVDVEVTHAALDAMVATPAAATITAGDHQAYTVSGTDEFDNSLGDVTDGTTFTIDGTDASCTNATCSGTLVGSYTVTAANGAVETTATLTVEAGPVASLVLTPANSTVPAGTDVTFTADGLDGYGNELGDVTSDVAFTVEDGECANGDNVCSATTLGAHTVSAATTSGPAASGTTQLTIVEGPLADLAVATGPGIVAGGAATITAEGLDAFGHTLGDVTADTDFELDGGTCVENVCTTIWAGTWTITATNGSVVQTADLVVTAGVLDGIAVYTPGGGAIAGETFSATAIARDGYGNAIEDVSDDTTFTIDDAPCAIAACRTTAAGTSTVLGDYSGKRNSATIGIRPATASTLTLTAAAASIIANGTSETTVDAVVVDAFGNVRPDDVLAFSAAPAAGAPTFGNVIQVAGGITRATVTSSTKAGAYTLRAAVAGQVPVVAGMTALRLTPDTAAHATLTLASTSIVADGASRTTAKVTVTDASGNGVEGARVVLTTDGGQVIGAVVDAGDGTYTAPVTSTTTAGSSTLRAVVTQTGAATAPTPATATLEQRAGAATRLQLRLAAAELVADGASSTTATVSRFDAHGNRVTAPGAVTITADTGLRVGDVTAAADGTHGATITTSTTFGAATVTATSGSLTATASLTLRERTVPVVVTPEPPVPVPVVLLPVPPVTPGAPHQNQLPVTGTTITVPVSCPATAVGQCTGTITVTVGGVVVATGPFTLAPGASAQVPLTLTPAAMIRFGARPMLDAKVAVTATDAAGTTMTSSADRVLALSRFKGVVVKPQVLTLDRRNRTTVTISCPTTAVGPCTGSVLLRALVDKQLLKGKWRTLDFGTRRFSIPRGRTVRVQVQLTNLAAHLLRSRTQFRAAAIATSRDTITGDRTTKGAITIGR